MFILLSIRNSDLILVHEGRLIENGTHNSLLNLGGRYSALYSQQGN